MQAPYIDKRGLFNSNETVAIQFLYDIAPQIVEIPTTAKLLPLRSENSANRLLVKTEDNLK